MLTLTKKSELTIGKVTVNSAAQLMTLTAYGDCNFGQKAGMPFRNLDFRASCEDYNDFEKCIQLIDSYNDYDAAGMLPALQRYLNQKKYYNEGNPNNGNSFFKFEIAREGSPAFYVSFIPQWDRFMYDGNNQPQGYDLADFKRQMANLKDIIKADEMNIEEGSRIEARFWFD